MHTDPIVEEVRDARRKIMAECHNDPNEFLQRMLARQELVKDRLVCGKPKPAPRISTKQ